MMPIAFLIILLGLTTGCASTLQAKPERLTQAFQEHVKEGLVAEAVVPHVHPPIKVNWSAYDKVYLRPVTISDGFSSDLRPEEKEELRALAHPLQTGTVGGTKFIKSGCLISASYC